LIRLRPSLRAGLRLGKPELLMRKKLRTTAGEGCRAEAQRRRASIPGIAGQPTLGRPLSAGKELIPKPCHQPTDRLAKSAGSEPMSIAAVEWPSSFQADPYFFPVIEATGFFRDRFLVGSNVKLASHVS